MYDDNNGGEGENSMTAIHQGQRKLSFLSDARKIIQNASKEKGLTEEQIKQALTDNEDDETK